MLICACPASISWRLLSTEQSSFFFQPVQLYFELPDLLVEFVLQLCFRSLRSFAAIAKRLLQMLECLLLPLPNLVGMHAVVRRDLVHAAHTLDRFQRHFAFQSRAVLPALFAHRSSARAPILHLMHLSSFWGVAQEWWPGTESNRRRRPFQGRALPTELPGQMVGKRPRSIGTEPNSCQLVERCELFVG